MNRLLLLCFLSFFCTLHTGAQSFEAVVDYDHVAVNDTVKLVFVYSGSRDSFASYRQADLSKFTIAGGPFQAQNTQMTRQGNTMHRIDATYITYNVLMDKPGRFSIPPASIFTKGGKKYATLPITIEVSPAPFIKGKPKASPLLSGAGNPFADPLFVRDKQKENEAVTIYYANEKIKNVHAPYVLITGWVYLPADITLEQSELIMSRIDGYMASRSDVRELSRITGSGAARRYYSLNDTTGLIKALFSVYKSAGQKAKARAVIADPAAWSVGEERYTFGDDEYVWRSIYNLLMQLEKKGITPGTPVTAQIKLSFDNLDKMDRFIAYAENKGYKVSASKRARELQVDFYWVSLSKLSEARERPLYKVIHQLTDEARQKEFSGSFMELSVTPK